MSDGKRPTGAELAAMTDAEFGAFIRASGIKTVTIELNLAKFAEGVDARLKRDIRRMRSRMNKLYPKDGVGG